MKNKPVYLLDKDINGKDKPFPINRAARRAWAKTTGKKEDSLLSPQKGNPWPKGGTIAAPLSKSALKKIEYMEKLKNKEKTDDSKN